MRENSKGFTLIELLAIIVILAIIALITAPVILNVIEDSRKNSAVDKAWGTIDAVRVAYTTAQVESEVGFPYTVHFDTSDGTEGTLDNTTGTGAGTWYVNNTKVKVSGDKSTEGWVTITKDGEFTAHLLKFGNYYCSTVKKGDTSKLAPNSMTCSRTKSDVTVSSLTAGTDYIALTTTNPDSGSGS